MKNLIRACVSAIVLFTLLLSSACGPSEPLVIKESDTYIIINVVSTQVEITENTTLLDYMNSLKEDGQLEFEIENGMINSVNGIKNPSDWSKCWMLYTSDSDNSNSAWGEVEYNGKVYGSAIFGAETLKVKDGFTYVWIFKEFD